MSRNLNQEEKEKLRDKFEEHIFFRLVNQSCKRYEREMKYFRFSPEDVFVESLNILDDLKAPNKNNDDLCDTLWDDLFCEFRYRGENIPEEELNKAVAIVLSMVTYCLVLVDSMRYNGLVGKLSKLMQEHYPNYLNIQISINMSAQKIGMESIKHGLVEYMQTDSYLSEEVEDSMEEKEEEGEKEETDSKKVPDKVRAKVLLEILSQCGLGLDTQDMTKVARLVGFIIGASPASLRNKLTSYNGLILSDKTHGKHIEEINKLLSEMKSKIKLECE